MGVKDTIGNVTSNVLNTVMGSGIFQPVLVQFGPKSANTMEDVDYNTDRIIEYMERACTGFPGIDMIIFPECCFQGMAPNNWVKVALTWDSEPIKRVQAKCKELEIWGCFDPWILNKERKGIENTCIIINDKGEIVHKYVKMNPWFPYEPTLPGHHHHLCGLPVSGGLEGSGRQRRERRHPRLPLDGTVRQHAETVEPGRCTLQQRHGPCLQLRRHG